MMVDKSHPAKAETPEPLASRLSYMTPDEARAHLAETSPDHLLFVQICEAVGIVAAARLYLDFWCEHVCFVRARDRVATAIGEEAATVLATAFGHRRHHIVYRPDTTQRHAGHDDMWFIFCAISEALADQLDQAKDEVANEIGTLLGCDVSGASLDIFHLMAAQDMLIWFFRDHRPVWWEALRKMRAEKVRAARLAEGEGATDA